MKRVAGIAVTSFFVLGLSTAFAAAPWGYEGAGAPEHWSELSKKNMVCKTGKQQSPIAIDTKAIQVDKKLEPLKLSYVSDENVEKEINTKRHTIKIELEKFKKDELQWKGETYYLKEFHFHSPSEHTVDGKQYPVDIHFVHENGKGQAVAVNVFIEEGKEDNKALQEIIAALPKTANSEKETHTNLFIEKLLPSDADYYYYDGSLTTPPCSEPVQWVVLTHPISVSAKQIKFLQKFLHGNSRPVQPMNGRVVTANHS